MRDVAFKYKNPIVEMMAKTVGDTANLQRFYREVKKHSPGSITIGVKFNGEWYSGSDEFDKLPKEPLHDIEAEYSITGIKFNAIVEGSEVELDGGEFSLEDFSADKFWSAVGELEQAVDFYFQRDNYRWYYIFKGSDLVAHVHLNFDAEVEWDDAGSLTGKEQSQVETAILSNAHEIFNLCDPHHYTWRWGETLDRGHLYEVDKGLFILEYLREDDF